jgi:GntR family transcriptional regulator
MSQSNASTLLESLRRLILEDGGSNPSLEGRRIGAERELAVRLGTSRTTLRHALAVLEQEHLIYRIPGRGGGVFVGSPRVQRDVRSVSGLPVPAYLASQGFEAGGRVLATRLEPATAQIAAQLEIEAGSQVVHIHRLVLADGRPLSAEWAWLPANRFPGVLDRPLGGNVYHLLDTEYGVRPGEAVEQIQVEQASAEAAGLLDIPVGAPVLDVERVTRDEDGVVFEVSHDLFRADRTRITLRAAGGASALRAARDVVVGAPAVPAGHGASPAL